MAYKLSVEGVSRIFKVQDTTKNAIYKDNFPAKDVRWSYDELNDELQFFYLNEEIYKPYKLLDLLKDDGITLFTDADDLDTWLHDNVGFNSGGGATTGQSAAQVQASIDARQATPAQADAAIDPKKFLNVVEGKRLLDEKIDKPTLIADAGKILAVNAAGTDVEYINAASTEVTGQLVGNSATFAALPTTDSLGDPVSNGDWAILTTDEIGTGDAANPQFPRGIYTHNGTVYSFAFEISDSFVTPDASTTVKGISEHATDAEAVALTATDKTVTPANLQALRATTGLVTAGFNGVSYVTPFQVKNEAQHASIDVTGFPAAGAENAVGINNTDDTIKKVIDKLENYVSTSGKFLNSVNLVTAANLAAMQALEATATEEDLLFEFDTNSVLSYVVVPLDVFIDSGSFTSVSYKGAVGTTDENILVFTSIDGTLSELDLVRFKNIDSTGFATAGNENALGLNTTDDTIQKVVNKLEAYDPTSTGIDPWTPATVYAAGQEFEFTTANTTAVDSNGDKIDENKIQIGQYTAGATSGATLTNVEMALITLVSPSLGGAIPIYFRNVVDTWDVPTEIANRPYVVDENNGVPAITVEPTSLIQGFGTSVSGLGTSASPFMVSLALNSIPVNQVMYDLLTAYQQNSGVYQILPIPVLDLYEHTNAVADVAGTEGNSLIGIRMENELGNTVAGDVTTFRNAEVVAGDGGEFQGNFYIRYTLTDIAAQSHIHFHPGAAIQVGDNVRINYSARTSGAGVDAGVYSLSGASGSSTIPLTDTWANYTQVVNITSADTFLPRFRITLNNPGSGITNSISDFIEIGKVSWEKLALIETGLLSTNTGQATWNWNGLTIYDQPNTTATSLGTGITIIQEWGNDQATPIGDEMRLYLHSSNPDPTSNTAHNGVDAGNKRVEVYEAPFTAEKPAGTEEWIGYNYRIGSNYVADINNSVLIFQSKPNDENGFSSPPISLLLTENGLAGNSTGDLVVHQIANAAEYANTGITPVAGQTLKIVMHIIHQEDATGIFELWVDDVQVYSTSAPTMYPGSSGGGVLKVGLYKYGWQDQTGVDDSVAQGIPDIEMFLGQVKIERWRAGDAEYGTNRYNNVAP